MSFMPFDRKSQILWIISTSIDTMTAKTNIVVAKASKAVSHCMVYRPP